MSIDKNEKEARSTAQVKEKDWDNICAWTALLAKEGGLELSFVKEFLELLSGSEAVSEEYAYFMHNNTFLGKHSICGMSVVDIMIWQTDHFKSDLDRGKYDMQNNPNKMLLMAFHTMLMMEKEPQKYLEQYAQDTGTDYPGKY